MENRDIPDERIREKSSFIAWLNHNVSAEYLHMPETDACFSPVRDYTSISGIAYSDIKENLIHADRTLAEGHQSGFRGLAHVLGDDCERCLRIINARAVYLVRHHSGIFTESVHKLAWLELLQRKAEKKQGKPANDNLYLIQASLPYRGCDSIREAHLSFYDPVSLQHGIQAMFKRVKSHPSIVEAFPDILDSVCFSQAEPFEIPPLTTPLISADSWSHIQKDNGQQNITRVAIISKR